MHPLPGTQPACFCSSAHSASILTKREVIAHLAGFPSPPRSKPSEICLALNPMWMIHSNSIFIYSRSNILEWKYEFVPKLVTYKYFNYLNNFKFNNLKLFFSILWYLNRWCLKKAILDTELWGDMNSNSSLVFSFVLFSSIVYPAQKGGPGGSQLRHLNCICSSWKMYYHLTLFSLFYFTQSKFWKMTPNFFLKQTPLTNKIHITVAITCNSSCSIFLDNGYIFNEHAWKANPHKPKIICF